LKERVVETGFVYAVEVAELGAIKIGFTKRPVRRLAKIRSSLKVAYSRKIFSVKVLLITAGTNAQEHAAHAQLRAHRLEMRPRVTGKTEWYMDVPEVRAWVADAVF
jgi:predicted GIY-YIG superfamily endonuclease